MWPSIKQAYQWVHHAAHLLNNSENLPVADLQATYQALLEEMAAHKEEVGSLTGALETFLKVTTSFWPGLFHCYQVKDLPRTNNDLEQCFGSVRHHERRTTGRRGAVPGLVVRGSVRLVASLATRLHSFTPDELRLTNLLLWRHIRERLAFREEARRRQCRFRKNPSAYLLDIETRLLKR
jgi:hypothetical protein